MNKCYLQYLEAKAQHDAAKKALDAAHKALISSLDLPPNEVGTFNCGDFQVVIPATFKVEYPQEAFDALPRKLGDAIMPAERKFSRSAYNALLKSNPELEDWFIGYVETRLGKAQIK